MRLKPTLSLLRRSSLALRLFICLSMGLFLFWGAFNAPGWYQLQHYTLTVPAKTKASSYSIIGKYQLAAKDADVAHIAIQRVGGHWQLQNISQSKKLLLIHPSGKEQYARQWPLQAGDGFATADTFFTVERISAGQMVFRQLFRDGRRILWRYSDDRLWRNGELLPNCPEVTFKANLTSWWNRLSDKIPWKFSRPLRLGGHVYCGQRLGIVKLPPDSLQINRYQQQFYLTPGRALNNTQTPVYVSHQQKALLTAWQQQQWENLLTLQTLPLSPQNGNILVVGHSFFTLKTDAKHIVFAPLSRSQRHVMPPNEAGASWIKIDPVADFTRFPQKTALLLLSVAVSGALLALLKPVYVLQHNNVRKKRLALWCYLLLALWGAMTWYYAERMPVLWSLALVWAALLSWLIIPWRSPRSSDMLLLITLLLGTGLMTQMQLGLGAAESHWLQYFTKTAGISAMFLWALRGLYVYKPTFSTFVFKEQSARYWYWGILLLTLLLLSLQWVAGSEGGVWGLQPVEWVKLVMLGFAAYALAQFRRRQTWTKAMWRKKIIVWALAPLLLMFALVTVALWLLRDFSPLVLMGVWLFGLAFAYQATETRVTGKLVLFVVLIIVIAAIYGIHQYPDSVSFLAQSDRITTWAQPALYPHSGYQLRRALDAIVEGGWFGVGSLFSFWPVQTDAARIPAIQDDFAPSLLIHHFGRVTALGVLLLEWLLLIRLYTIAIQCYHGFVEKGRGHHHKMLFGWFMFYLICGGAAMLLAHIIVSWSTNTALLPVMGQPLPFVSAAGSHLLFFVFPLLFISLWVDEECVRES